MKNREKFLVEKIDISFIKITPEIITSEKEFTKNFFSKIDEIEDLIINNNNINEISKKYNLKVKTVNEYYPRKDSEDLLDEIYKKRNKKVLEILEKNDFFYYMKLKI